MASPLWEHVVPRALADEIKLGETGKVLDIQAGLQRTAKAAGYKGDNLLPIIEQLIKTFLGLIGVVFLFMMLWAGFNWMTAMGDKEKVTKARDTIISSAIGIVVIISAYAITIFVFKSLGSK